MLPTDEYGYLAIPEVDSGVLSSFCCGKTHLDKFLKNTALALHESRLGFTCVVFHQQVDGPVGYFTLANDAIPLNESEKFELSLHDDITLNAFPAVKIGRLAVSEEFQGNGVGSAIMDIIIGEILDNANAFSAARLIVVDADNDDWVIRFYRRLGFENSLWAEDRARNHSKRGKVAAAVKMHRDILRA